MTNNALLPLHNHDPPEHNQQLSGQGYENGPIGGSKDGFNLAGGVGGVGGKGEEVAGVLRTG